MKKILLASAAITALCSGCASTTVDHRATVDQKQVGAVESAAWARGAKVYWRILPTKEDKRT